MDTETPAGFANIKRRANAGSANAEDCMGTLYFDGDPGNGVPQDLAKSLFWTRKAALQGDADAQAGLGQVYDFGQGVPQDYAQAAVWYRKAALQSYAGAQYNLGLLYANGQGVPQDYAVAATWYRKAAMQGLAAAQNNLGVLYALGQGVPQDYEEAYFWSDLAAAGLRGQPAEIAAQNRDDEASHLTPSELTRLQERARRWFASHPTSSQ